MSAGHALRSDRRGRRGDPHAAPPVRLGRTARTSLLLPTFLVLAFIYVPIVVMGLLSFQGPQGGASFPFRDPGLLWYRSLLDLRVITEHPSYLGQAVFDFKPALARSLLLAAVTSVVSTALALAAAQAMRTRFRGARAATYGLLLGIVTPGLAVSLGVASLTSEIGVPSGLFRTGLLVHVVWTMPFSFLLFMIMFNRFDRRVEEAGYTLGGSRLRVFWTITMPILKPAVIGSLLFAFMLSFDEYAHSIFVMGADQTLPLQLVASAQLRITPSIFALGTVIMVVSLAMLAVYVGGLRRSTRRVEQGAERSSRDG